MHLLLITSKASADIKAFLGTLQHGIPSLLNKRLRNVTFITNLLAFMKVILFGNDCKNAIWSLIVTNSVPANCSALAGKYAQKLAKGLYGEVIAN